MQPSITMRNLPMAGGFALSIAIHAALLGGRWVGRPPIPNIETGRTVLQLTLAPSVASRAAAPAGEPAAPIPLPPAFADQPPAPTASAEPLVPAGQTEPAESGQVETPPSVDSTEQDASLEEDKGVTAEAEAVSAIQPVYPRISRRRGEEGEVVLSVEVLASGRTGLIEILHSSGHSRLDRAACDAARSATFTPARRLGRAIDSTAELSFTFTLTDD